MKLLEIKQTIEENQEFSSNPACQEILEMTVSHYKKVGYVPPWIGYFAVKGNQIVGSAGFKGPPSEGKVEIAYGTVEEFRHQGIGTEICELLRELSLRTDPTLEITARTLPERNHSVRILEKNGFKLLGTVMDKEDGEVWEWKFQD